MPRLVYRLRSRAIPSGARINRAQFVRKRLVVDSPAGAFALTGSDAALTLVSGYFLDAEPGSFALGGQAAALKVSRRLAATPGSFALNGQDASFMLGKTLDAEAGAIDLTGQPAGVLHTRKLVAGAGAFELTGADATMRKGLEVSAEAGAFGVTGSPAGFRTDRKVIAGAGAFSVGGQAAALERHRKLAAAAGSFAVTGQDATFTRTYVANAVAFDGTNDYLTRGAALTGVSDSKLWTGSFWIKGDADSVNGRILHATSTAGGATEQWTIIRQTTDRVTIAANDSGGVNRLSVRSSDNSIEAADGWRHVMFSFDMADTGKRHLYVQDASDLTVTTYTDAALDFTNGDVAIGAVPNGTTKFDGDLADVQIWFGVYLDLSVQANRRLFISATGKPVRPSEAQAVLGTPHIELSGPLASWHTNKGSGGGFTVNGALGAAATTPSA